MTDLIKKQTEIAEELHIKISTLKCYINRQKININDSNIDIIKKIKKTKENPKRIKKNIINEICEITGKKRNSIVYIIKKNNINKFQDTDEIAKEILEYLKNKKDLMIINDKKNKIKAYQKWFDSNNDRYQELNRASSLRYYHKNKILKKTSK